MKKFAKKITKKKMYTSVRDKLDTGDIVLFGGKGGISAGIKWFTNSRWSHVGMVLRLSGWDMVLLWESTTLSNIKDVTDGKAKRGVQLVPLSERMRTYDGDVAFRLLTVNRTPTMLDALAAFRTKVKDRDYEADKMELINAAYDGWFGDNHEDLSTLFCSELVAESYREMGVLSSASSALPSNEYTPKDFSTDGEPLKLLKNAKLSKEIFVKYT